MFKRGKSVSDGDELFLTNQADVRFFPDYFRIDFKQVNQVINRVGELKSENIVINHRFIVLTPLMMKQLVVLLNKVLSDYEKQFGEITLPKTPKSVKKTKKSNVYIG